MRVSLAAYFTGLDNYRLLKYPSERRLALNPPVLLCVPLVRPQPDVRRIHNARKGPSRPLVHPASAMPPPTDTIAAVGSEPTPGNQRRQRRLFTSVQADLCRPSIAGKRVTEQHDGRFRVELKTAWRDGTTAIFLSPANLTARLAALIPLPARPTIRYSGAFALNAKLRPLVVQA